MRYKSFKKADEQAIRKAGDTANRSMHNYRKIAEGMTKLKSRRCTCLEVPGTLQIL